MGFIRKQEDCYQDKHTTAKTIGKSAKQNTLQRIVGSWENRALEENPLEESASSGLVRASPLAELLAFIG